jgi:hypothetical protein
MMKTALPRTEVFDAGFGSVFARRAGVELMLEHAESVAAARDMAISRTFMRGDALQIGYFAAWENEAASLAFRESSRFIHVIPQNLQIGGDKERIQARKTPQHPGCAASSVVGRRLFCLCECAEN